MAYPFFSIPWPNNPIGNALVRLILYSICCSVVLILGSLHEAIFYLNLELIQMDQHDFVTVDEVTALINDHLQLILDHFPSYVPLRSIRNLYFIVVADFSKLQYRKIAMADYPFIYGPGSQFFAAAYVAAFMACEEFQHFCDSLDSRLFCLIETVCVCLREENDLLLHYLRSHLPYDGDWGYTNRDILGRSLRRRIQEMDDSNMIEQRQSYETLLLLLENGQPAVEDLAEPENAEESFNDNGSSGGLDNFRINSSSI